MSRSLPRKVAAKKRVSHRKVTFVAVRTGLHVQATVRLARRIWTEHYVPLIGRAQVDYMLARFQSREAIAAQLRDGYRYYLLRYGASFVGYLAIVPRPQTRELFLSKLYVLSRRRGRGFGKQALAFAERIANNLKLRRITLTVNKRNLGSRNFYRRHGFVSKGSVIKDIGDGYVMDDFVLGKPL